MQTEKTIWRRKIDMEALNSQPKRGMLAHLDIKLIEVGPDFLKGSMPVDHRTHQPFGILHGGASVVLAESLGSLAGTYCLDEGYCVGLNINSNHIRPVSNGLVIGTTRPYHLGRTTQVWHIEIHTEKGKLVNVSRLTLAVIAKDAEH